MYFTESLGTFFVVTWQSRRDWYHCVVLQNLSSLLVLLRFHFTLVKELNVYSSWREYLYLEVRWRNLLVKQEHAILGFAYIFSRSLKVLSGENSEEAHPKTKQEGKKEKFGAVTEPVFI